MKHRMSKLLLATAWMVTAATLAADSPEKHADKTAYVGHPVSLVVQPETIRLAGPRAMRQMLVTGRYSDGSERDLTSFCEMKLESPDLAKVSRGGLLRAQKAGETVLVIQAGERTARVPIIVTDFDKSQPVSFRHEFIAALNVAGCNAGACHGIPSGRGGF